MLLTILTEWLYICA